MTVSLPLASPTSHNPLPPFVSSPPTQNGTPNGVSQPQPGISGGIQWAQGEAVTVNTRALIDKVLARYSAEHTVLREMFQNAADAEAKVVQLIFESPGRRDDNSGDREMPQLMNGNRLRGAAVGTIREKQKDKNTAIKDEKVEKKNAGIFSRLKSSALKSSESRTNMNLLGNSSRRLYPFSAGSSSSVKLPSSSIQVSQPTANKCHLSNVSCTRLIIKNNGHPFRPQDWSRLKRIAEGNPDENKIGAFGVGFYSVFSECDEPTVYSGDQAMSFYWIGNQLFTKQAEGLTFDPWTTFVLPYRTPTTPPDLGGLARFVANSLTFVGLEGIEVFVDDVRVFAVTKEIGKSRTMEIPIGLKNAMVSLNEQNSTNSLIEMNVEKVDVTEVEMRAEYEPCMVSGLDDAVAQARGQDSVKINVWTAFIETKVEAKTAEELTRATLKPPPKKTRLSLVSATSGNRLRSDDIVGGIFHHILPGTLGEDILKAQSAVNNPGRIFISFQTHQTTGFQAHLSTHSVIPTVERENIDFAARHVKTWNVEMMRVAAMLCRIMYHHEVSRMRNLTGQEALAAMKEIMQRYSFKASTPAAIVGDIIRVRFFELTKKANSRTLKQSRCVFEILSKAGVKDVESVRLLFPSDISDENAQASATGEPSLINPCPDPSQFLESTLLLPKELALASPIFVENLKAQGILKQISVGEIVEDFSKKARSLEHGKAALYWLIKKRERNEVSEADVKKILGAISISIPPENSYQQRTISLQTISVFTNPSGFVPASKKIGKNGTAVTLPLPLNCIPPSLTVDLNPRDLNNMFKWKELDVVQWVRHICGGTYFTQVFHKANPHFAKDFLGVVSGSWASLDASKKTAIKALLEYRHCLPTKAHGLLPPNKVHFASVRWAGNTIPVADNDIEEFGEQFLSTLGVRKTVELKLVLQNLMKQDKKGDTCHQYDVINYLLSINEEVSGVDMGFLRGAAFCSAEGINFELYRPSELFEPDDRLRMLGLPTLKWPVPWGTASFAAKRILENLGLQVHPKLTRLAYVAASKSNNRSIREAALSYLIERISTVSAGSKYAQAGTPVEDDDLNALMDIAFLPTDEAEALFTPKQIYSNPRCSMFRFPVLRKDLRPHAEKIGVREHPSADDLVSALLENPPKAYESAVEVFEYLGTQVGELNAHQLDLLGKSDIVPISWLSSIARDGLYLPGGKLEKRSGKILSQKHKLVKPCSVFVSVAGPNTEKYMQLFDVVNFGMQANVFLMKCGAGSRPSDLDVAKLMISDPYKVLDVIGIQEYRGRLRGLALNPQVLQSEGLAELMRHAPFLIGTKIAKEPKQDSSLSILKRHSTKTEVPLEDEDDEEQEVQQILLGRASDIIIVDDYWSYKLFREHILVAPFEEELEEFYYTLGSPFLSERLKVDFQVIRNSKNDSANRDTAEKLRKIIVERAPLFFHENRHGAKYETKAWLAGLQVRVVENIAVVRSIRGDRDPLTGEPRSLQFRTTLTAAIPEKEKNDATTLLVVNGYNTFDVSQALIHALMRAPKASQAYLLDCLLREDLKVLEQRGYNVKRIIKARQAEEEYILKAAASSKKDTESDPSNEPQAAETKTITDMQMPKLDSTLQKAIKSSQRFNGTLLQSSSTSMEVVDKGSYCDSSIGHNLVYHATTRDGIRVFLQQKHAASQRQATYKKHQDGFQSFGHILKTLTEIFGLDLSAVHLFLDTSSLAMAFNRSGSLFFNLKYFTERHHAEVMKNNTANALASWYMVMCHELAHNLVLNHSSSHSYHLEELAAKFIQRLHQVLQSSAAAASSSKPLGNDNTVRSTAHTASARDGVYGPLEPRKASASKFGNIFKKSQ